MFLHYHPILTKALSFKLLTLRTLSLTNIQSAEFKMLKKLSGITHGFFPVTSKNFAYCNLKNSGYNWGKMLVVPEDVFMF